MNAADFLTATNGFPLESDSTLGFMQASYLEGIRALARMAGTDNVIITGLKVVNGSASDGYILKDGDLVRFVGGQVAANYVIEVVAQEKANEDGELYERYFTKTARFGSGVGSYQFAQLVRAETLTNLVGIIRTTFGDGNIIAGCESTVNGATVQISAGAAFLGENYTEVPGYAGSFPAYLLEGGVWTATLPTVGAFITFDPYTADRIEYSYRRKMTPSGQVIMFVGDLSNFTGAGTGRWALDGFALMDGRNGTFDMRGRMPIGYDERATDPGNGVWDPSYRNVGAAGGDKRVALTVAEMPVHRHGPAVIAEGDVGMIRKARAGENVTNAQSDPTAGEPDVVGSPAPVPESGGGQSHENRPPYRVLIYAQRL